MEAIIKFSSESIKRSFNSRLRANEAWEDLANKKREEMAKMFAAKEAAERQSKAEREAKAKETRIAKLMKEGYLTFAQAEEYDFLKGLEDFYARLVKQPGAAKKYNIYLTAKGKLVYVDSFMQPRHETDKLMTTINEAATVILKKLRERYEDYEDVLGLLDDIISTVKNPVMDSDTAAAEYQYNERTGDFEQKENAAPATPEISDLDKAKAERADAAKANASALADAMAQQKDLMEQMAEMKKAIEAEKARIEEEKRRREEEARREAERKAIEAEREAQAKEAAEAKAQLDAIAQQNAEMLAMMKKMQEELAALQA